MSGEAEFERRLASAVRGEALFDRFSRGRYATDASIYQVFPRGVVIPKDVDDVIAALAVAREAGVPITPRGGGTSQCGQTVNHGVVLDLSKHLNKIIDIDAENLRAVVEPGVVLDQLNAALRPHGLWYPVDVSTASRATLGGMTANNSCGSRSIRYGSSRDNVVAIDALLADGTRARFAEIVSGAEGGNQLQTLTRDLLALGAREADEIASRFPKVARRVGGYNIDALTPDHGPINLAHLLVGSEGTLAFSERITLKLSPLPGAKVMGVCHFPSFYAAMDAAQHLVTLDPTAVELVDHTLLALARDIPMFQPLIAQFTKGDPKALLIVEFAEPDMAENRHRLAALHDMMAELGFRWGDPAKQEGGVVDAVEPKLQAAITEVRTQGLNIMMSMKTEGKPVSFIEDCCVELKDLAEYTDRLINIFHQHGSEPTFYAHASVGTLHVRPVLNLKQEAGVRAMRAIAEETFAMVREYKGSHSGEHGDGIVRSEFHSPMFGERVTAAFGEVKQLFDPQNILNPGRIVDPPKMDERSLFRYPPGYAAEALETVFRWPGYAGAGRGLQGAVEMCNNNGACRKLKGGAMCPSYRVTRDERHLVRGRANSLRLALTGQLGADALASPEMAAAMKLCVSCKACRRECPTGVDMAKMKIEAQAARLKAGGGLSLRDRLVAYLPRYAPYAARAPWLPNLRNDAPGAARLSEWLVGLAADRSLPRWSRDVFQPSAGDVDQPEAVLFADTFNRYFEAQNLRAAEAVLRASGLPLGHAKPSREDPIQRPLCCGRTFLSVGLVDEARAEMRRALAVIRPVLERGGYVIGLEPSCLLTFRDEAPVLLDDWPEELAARVMLFEEYLAMKLEQGLHSPFRSGGPRAYLHGHCHQKAFNLVAPVSRVLAAAGVEAEVIDSSCCGMAGMFGYQAETVDVSRAMGELSLAPAVRSAPDDAVILADGVSCRGQIEDGTGREAVHVAQFLARLL